MLDHLFRNRVKNLKHSRSVLYDVENEFVQVSGSLFRSVRKGKCYEILEHQRSRKKHNLLAVCAALPSSLERSVSTLCRLVVSAN